MLLILPFWRTLPRDDMQTTTISQPGKTATPRLCVVSAANVRYLPGVFVAFHSLLRHLDPAWGVDFKLLTDHLDERPRLALQRILQSTNRDHTLEIISIDLSEYEALPAQHGSKLAYARLLMPTLIAADRVLYLDCDIVVGKDVSRLAALPWAEGCLLYAVNDSRITTFSMPWEHIPCEALGIPPEAPYFNSGFLWINLAEWRRAGIEAAGRAYMQRFPGGLHWHDQSVLNAVLWKNWQPLDKTWNLEPEQTMHWYELYPLTPRKDVNVHYIGGTKPWLERSLYQHFYQESVAEITTLAPQEFPAIPEVPGETRKRLWHFARRAFFSYGGFFRRKLRKLVLQPFSK